MTSLLMGAGLVVCAGLAACQAAPEPLPPPVYTAPSVARETKAPVAAVSLAYRQAQSRELPKVFGPAATADYIRRIHLADQAARRAIHTLELQGRSYTQAALVAARDAVHTLSNVLESEP